MQQMIPTKMVYDSLNYDGLMENLMSIIFLPAYLKQYHADLILTMEN